MADESVKMENGGGAFPYSHEVREYFKDGNRRFQVRLHQSDGMTLRDYFAGQALAALCTHSIILNDNDVQRAATADAYFIADAMLAEREKRNGKDNG